MTNDIREELATILWGAPCYDPQESDIERMVNEILEILERFLVVPRDPVTTEYGYIRTPEQAETLADGTEIRDDSGLYLRRDRHSGLSWTDVNDINRWCYPTLPALVLHTPRDEASR